MASIWRDKTHQFTDDAGDPLNAGTLDFYVTGTSTRKNAYSDEGLTTPIANPYTLNSNGRPAANIWISGRYKIVLKNSSGVQIGGDIDAAEDNMPASDFQDGSPSYATAVGGTATAITLTFSPTLAALTDGMVIGWKWGADTTGATTINPDGLGAKSLVKRDGAAIAAGDGQQNDQATARYNSSQNRFELVSSEGMLYRDGNNAPARADVASAATLNLDTAGTNYVNITGTTTVTAITLTDGRYRRCRCNAALPITTGASLIINGISSGITVTFAAGDTFEAWGEASGVVRIVSISRVARLTSDVATTSGTSVAVATGLPSGLRRITIMFNGVALSGSDDLLVQIGDSGGLETTSYASSSGTVVDAAASSVNSSTSGFIVNHISGDAFQGHMVLTLMSESSNRWIASHAVRGTTNRTTSGGGAKALSATLDRITLVPTGTDTFSSGQVNILYE